MLLIFVLAFLFSASISASPAAAGPAFGEPAALPVPAEGPLAAPPAEPPPAPPPELCAWAASGHISAITMNNLRGFEFRIVVALLDTSSIQAMPGPFTLFQLCAMKRPIKGISPALADDYICFLPESAGEHRNECRHSELLKLKGHVVPNVGLVLAARSTAPFEKTGRRAGIN